MLRAHCLVFFWAVASAAAFDLGDTDIVFHLFDRRSPTVSTPLFPSLNSIAMSTFNIGAPTVITIHDHGESVSAGTSNFNAFVIPSELELNDVNLVACDWSTVSSMYTEGLGYAPQVGQIVANFANIIINNFGYSASQIKIVGNGLGGHIAGIAARNIVGTVPHIVALNPSLHGWSHHFDRLGSDAAAVVEVLHTTAGSTGYDFPLGDLDFYPNGGSYQNGCGTGIECSHIYSYVFYSESLTAEARGGPKFVGTKCGSYLEAISQSCSGERDAVFGGSESKNGVTGIYTFSTNFVQPFAQD